MVRLSLETLVNRNLFSRHYLEERLPESEEWERTEDDAREAFEELKQIYQRQADTLPERTNDEEGVRDKFINPVLKRVLGFKTEKEKSTTSGTAPDFALFASQEDVDEAMLGEGDFYENALAVLEAKAWGKRLEKKKRGGGQEFEANNPTVQIVQYLFQTDPQWGILTNGREWRLFNQQESSKLDTYFSVDLVNIIKEEDFEAFRFFYFLFRKDAYTGGEGNTELDRLLEQSHRYAREIGEDLEDNVYQALEWLAKGYLGVSTNNLDPEDDLERVHDKSLIFLYRLLFLFYVDSRGVLPDPDDEWYSFRSLIDSILNDIDNNDVTDTSTEYWVRLNEIFKVIDQGSDAHDLDVDIPAYNGKLFSNEEHQFLRDKQVQNKYLARVVDLLARTGGDTPVDYADLSVRHLGGIYEGLLEYELIRAPERRVVEDGEWIPVEGSNSAFEELAEDMRVDEGEVYLETDQGERKVTGSYYTPAYVVQYIVENTLDPQIDAIIEGAEDDEEIRNRILDLDVLDPAMGSGHFLVGAVDHIASRLLPYTEQDIQDVKRDVARRCIYGVDINPLATELAKVSIWLNTVSSDKPLSFLDHHLKTGNSLAGADVFDLDTHPAEERERDERSGATGQTTLADKFGGGDDGQAISDNIKQLLQMYRRIMDMPENQPDDIHEQEEIYHEFRQHKFRRRFDALADVYTSYWFGNEYSKKQYQDLLDAFQPGSDRWEDVVQQDWVRRATDAIDNAESENLSDRRRFFHWHLEFPEVFFDIESGTEQADPGFDVILGNPPYVRVQNLDYGDIDYFKKSFDTSYRRIDISLLFEERAIQYLSNKGYCSYVTSIQFLRAIYGKELRRKLMEEGIIEELIDLTDLQVFDDITTYVGILTLNRGKNSPTFRYARIKDRQTFQEGDWGYTEMGEDLDFIVEQGITGDIEFLRKLDDNFSPLSSIAKTHTGLTTGADSILIITKKEANERGFTEEYLEEFLRGRTINAYTILSPDEYVVYPYDEDGNLVPLSEIKEADPALHQYLLEHKEELKQRKDSREEVGEEGWHALIRKGQPSVFRSKKIVYAALARHNQFSIDAGGRAYLTGGAGVFGVTTDEELHSLLGVLNSNVAEYYLHQICPQKRGDYYSYIGSKVERLPLPELSSSELGDYVRQIEKYHKERQQINLSLIDYIRVSKGETSGEPLGTQSHPPSGVADTVLTDTKENRDNLRVGSVEFRESSGTLTLLVSARYKPEDEDAYETDQYGYTETDLIPAMEFHDLSEMQAALVKEFVPVAADKAGGFANFRETATKKKSLIDRLEALTLPKLDDVEEGLRKYLNVKERAEKLDRKIAETEELIDEIVYDLYGLDKEEIDAVERAVAE